VSGARNLRTPSDVRKGAATDFACRCASVSRCARAGDRVRLEVTEFQRNSRLARVLQRPHQENLE